MGVSLYAEHLILLYTGSDDAMLCNVPTQINIPHTGLCWSVLVCSRSLAPQGGL